MTKRLFITVLLLMSIAQVVFQKEAVAVPAYPSPINCKQPDGTYITIRLRGDEFVNWGETLDGYTLVNEGNRGWTYAVLNADGKLISSGIPAHNHDSRKTIETSFLNQIPKKLRYSQKQIDNLKASSNLRLKSTTATTAFNPTGTKKLLMILIQFPDLSFNYTQADFAGMMNTPDYSEHNAHGSVRDYFLENSYGQFDLTTDVAPHIYTAANNMAYYGANVDGNHSPNASELITEAINAADDDGVDFSQYDNDGDGSVDGIYVIYAGYGEATSGNPDEIWPHAGTISPAIICDGKSISKYSCSNELTYNSDPEIKDITTIGVICHEFGHVCGAPDYYDTDYVTGGSYIGNGSWDLMDVGLYCGNPSGSQPSHINPFEKIKAGWVTPVEVNSSASLTISDITTNPVVYKYNTPTADEYFLMENRQQTGFNIACPGHGLMIYHYSQTYWNATKNKTAPQGFYPVCASATTNPTTTSDASSYGSISSAGCPFPGSSGKTAFYDNSIPGSKSWAGENTEMPITGITENGDGTVTFTISTADVCTTAPTTQATSFIATPTVATSMDISWTRGNGDKVLVVAREGSTVDFDPQGGNTYTANANFKSGDEVGAGNYVVYDGTGTSATIENLYGNTQYFFAVYEYNSATNCYLKPALTGNGTTNCNIDISTFTEDFERSSFGCWTAVDNTGQGNWQIGITSNVNYTPALSGKYAYFECNYGESQNYNADLISPAFDLSSYSNVVLTYKHLFDASSYYPSTATVSYSINNGSTWVQLATYTSDSPSNPENVNLIVDGVIGQSEVKFKWNYTCSPTGAYMWAVDDIQVTDNSNFWTGAVDTDWFTAGNWSTGVVPSSTSSAVIPSAPVNQPQINGNGATCMNLTIQSGASLTMNGSTAYTLSVAGNWKNNGTFTAGIGTVDFNGTSNLQTITGTSTTTFYVLSVSKGSQSSILEATSPIALSAPSNPLVINSGTFKLSHAVTLTPFTSSVSLGSTAGFWNNGGTINAGGFGWTLNGGLLRVSAGTVNIGTNSGNGITYLNGGTLIIDGGELNVAARISPNSGSSSGSYTQSGGVVTVFTVGSTSTSRAQFEMNTGVPFTMSGGSIIVQERSSNSTADVIILSTTNSITGGTLQIGNAATTESPTIRINSTVPIFNLVIYETGTPGVQLVTNNLTLQNDLSIGAGTTLDANNLNITIGGDFTNNGTFTPGTALVTFNGTAAQSLSGTAASSFNNLTLNNSNGLSLSGSVDATVDGTLTLTSGVISTETNKLIISSTGSVSRTSGHIYGNLQKNIAIGTGISQIFEIGDDAEASYTPVSVDFAEVTTAGDLIAKTINGDHPSIGSSLLYENKSINRYWTITNNGVVFTTCDEIFNFLSTDLDAQANTSNLICGKYDSGWEYPTVGTLTSTSTQITGISSFGDFQLAEASKNSITAGGDWSDPATWSPSGVPTASDNIMITSPGTVIVDVTNAECANLTVQSGGVLQIDPAKSLTISETITNNSDATGLVIKSEATGTGSLIAGDISGQATSEHYITGDKWHVISATATGESIASFIQNVGNSIPSKDVSGTLYYGMMDYDEPTNQWNNYYTSSTAENISAGKGYIIRRSSDGVITFTGNLSSGTQTIAVSNTGEGWNCVGNPYPSAIMMNTAANASNNFLKINAIDASNLDPSYSCIYVWDQDALEYKILGNSNFGERDLNQNILQSGQGFFVKANSGSPSIQFASTMQIHQPDAVLKSAGIPWPGIELTVTDGQKSATTVITFNDQMTNGLDPTYDAGLLKGNSGLNLYSRLIDDNGVDFAVQCLPETYDSLVIPVGVDYEKEGYLTFSAEETGIPDDCNIILEDRLTTSTTLLNTGNSYSVAISPDINGTGRFYLHINMLALSDETTTIGSSGSFDIKAFYHENKINIIGKVDRFANASLTDMNGRRIGSYKLNEGNYNSIVVDGLRKGVYLLTVTDVRKYYVGKVIVY